MLIINPAAKVQKNHELEIRKQELFCILGQKVTILCCFTPFLYFWVHLFDFFSPLFNFYS